MSERFRVELVALAADRFSGVPAAVRLRQLLKIAGRRLGLRAVSVQRLRDDPSQTERSEMAEAPADGGVDSGIDPAGVKL